MSFSILLVDDHKIMRDGIKAILRDSDEFHVMAEAESGSEAVQICTKQRPDIVLMGLALCGSNGIETTAELVRFHPGIKIIILSMYEDEHTVAGAMHSGARAFVVKKASGEDLMNALRTVAKDGVYFSPQIPDHLLHSVQRGNTDSLKPLPSVLDVLSPRELQVLRLAAEGKANKEIAVLLSVGVHTVRTYRKTLMRKLGINNVAGLTQLALASGITHFAASSPGTAGSQYRAPSI